MKKYNLKAEEQMFVENIPLLMEHRERIMTSPELSGVAVPVVNGFALTGSMPQTSVGAYLDWWEDCPEMSHDRSGRLIWKISGSNLSGVSACQAADESGCSFPAELKAHVFDVAKSLSPYRQKYPVRPTALTLTSLIELLRSE